MFLLKSYFSKLCTGKIGWVENYLRDCYHEKSGSDDSSLLEACDSLIFLTEKWAFGIKLSKSLEVLTDFESNDSNKIRSKLFYLKQRGLYWTLLLKEQF